MKITRIIKNLLFIISVLAIIWFVASWIDTFTHNLPIYEDYKVYAPWNLFNFIPY